MKKTVCCLMWIITSFFSVAETDRIIFKEPFDGTGEKPAGYTDVCYISEAPPSLKTLCFRPAGDKQYDVHQGLFNVPPCTDYQLSFRFSFPQESKKAFLVTLVSGTSGQKTRNIDVVTISEKVMGIKPGVTGILPPSGGTDEELDIQPFLPNWWHQAIIRVRGKTIELFVENNGCLRKFAQAQSSGQPLLGFNFSGSTAVNFDDIQLIKIEPATGEFQEENGVKIARQPAVYRMDIASGTTEAEVSFRVGNYPGGIIIKPGWQDGTEKILEVKTFATRYEKEVLRPVSELDKDGRPVVTTRVVKEPVRLIDTGLRFREKPVASGKAGWNLDYYIRPRLQSRYQGQRALQILSNWSSFPGASEKFVRLQLRPDEKGVEMWLDSRYATRWDSSARLAYLSLILPAGAAIKNPRVSNRLLPRRFLPLDVREIAYPGTMAEAKLKIFSSRKVDSFEVVSGIPMIVAKGPENADTGVCRENLGSFFLECDGYLSRTPFDGMPESLLFSVPVCQYHRAWVLCAVEDDPDKVPVLTVRLTKFLPRSSVGRGPAIADTEINLLEPDREACAGIQKVGEIFLGGKKLPLYLVEAVLDSGNIQEIIYQEKPEWLDFEILGLRQKKDNFYLDRSRKPSDDPVSGVHVFGLTLEKSPVQMKIMPTVFGNIYQPEETPAMEITLSSIEKTSAGLSWKVTDINGNILEKKEIPLNFATPGEEKVIRAVFPRKELGWYQVDFLLAGSEGRHLLQHTAYFALIDRDKREAGYESPYFSWNFGGAHGTIKDINLWGPLLLKAGIRHTHVASEQAGAAWKLTKGQIPRLRVRSKDPQEAEKELEKQIKEHLEKYPHATTALIFHESGGGPFPLELLGEKTEVDEKQKEYDRQKMEEACLVARAYRKYAPHIKLVVGNSGGATPGLMASLFRAGIPRQYIDYIGDESAGMTVPPELSVARECWILKEVARVFGYGDIPIAACYEWKCRRSRHLGLLRYSQWRVRDVLIAHAWRFPLIPTEGLPEVATSYHHTVWGDGAFTHYPQVYPKPVYPAIATLTQLLDRARFNRVLATGSATVYALEFQKDKEFIYAFWTARGSLEASIEFPQETTVRLTEMLGSSREDKTSGNQLTILVDEGPVYVSSSVPLKTVSKLSNRKFPREVFPADKLVVVSSMADTSQWKLISGVDPRLDVPAKAPVISRSFRRPGKYILRQINASEEPAGECLELELIPESPCPALMQEYVFLRPVKPLQVPGKPTTIGVWVKGNSSWGKIFWEIEDAEGEKWLSVGTGGYGCDVYDWPEVAGINFDDWCFLQFPITNSSPVKVPSPGENAYQWQHDGRGNRRIDYPVKVTGLAVSLPRQTVYLCEMVPVKLSIRLRNLSVY